MYQTINPRKVEYKGLVFQARYTSAVAEEYQERYIIPLASDIVYFVDKNGNPHRFYSIAPVTEMMLDLFTQGGSMIIGVEPNSEQQVQIDDIAVAQAKKELGMFRKVH